VADQRQVQVRFALTLDEESKKQLEAAAEEFSNGRVSQYVRGLVVFHRLLLNRSPGNADIPGWVFGNYPLPLIQELIEDIEYYKKKHPTSDVFAPVPAAETSHPIQDRLDEDARHTAKKARTKE